MSARTLALLCFAALGCLHYEAAEYGDDGKLDREVEVWNVFRVDHSTVRANASAVSITTNAEPVSAEFAAAASKAWSELNRTARYAIAGALAGSIIPGVGTLAGAGAGGALGFSIDEAIATTSEAGMLGTVTRLEDLKARIESDPEFAEAFLEEVMTHLPTPGDPPTGETP